MYRKAIPFLALLVGALAVPTTMVNSSPRAFESWKALHGKTYESEEENARRYEIFQANARIVEQHNSEGHSWTMKMTQFADLTPKEFDELQTLMPGNLGTNSSSAAFRHSTEGREMDELPTSVDWRTQGLVNPVKDQAQCGSCWAFSTVVSYEGQVAKKSSLHSFSEQDLVDCVKNVKLPGDPQACCMGCNGGLMDYAFAYMTDDQSGLDATERSYPYRAADGSCKYSSSSTQGAMPVKSYTDITKGDESALKDAVATVGPISIAVNANFLWQMYGGGVFNPFICGKTRLNHGVAIVGYGSEGGRDYWIIRNSWGEVWGESGYMRIVAGSNACGLANSAVYPNL